MFGERCLVDNLAHNELRAEARSPDSPFDTFQHPPYMRPHTTASGNDPASRTGPNG